MELGEPEAPELPAGESDITDAVPGGQDTAPDPLLIVTGLERLAALHQDGSLSECEYTPAKQHLLN
jgi:hypothetical protein